MTFVFAIFISIPTVRANSTRLLIFSCMPESLCNSKQTSSQSPNPRAYDVSLLVCGEHGVVKDGSEEKRRKRAALPYSSVCGERIGDVAVMKQCLFRILILVLVLLVVIISFKVIENLMFLIHLLKAEHDESQGIIPKHA